MTRKLVRIRKLTIAEATSFYLEHETRKRKVEQSIRQEALWMQRLREFFRSYRKLGKIEHLQDIQKLHMEVFQTHLLRSRNRYAKYRGKNSRLLASSVNRMFNCYRHFFSRCVEWGFIDVSPCEGIKHLTEIDNIRKPWADKNFFNVCGIAADWFQDILLFARFTGARAGAISELNCGDVDFDRNMVGLKTRKGKRGKLKIYWVPMHREIRRMLLKRFRALKKTGARDPVFLNASGKRVSATHISRETRRLLKKAGLEDQGLGIHGLRHSLASKLHMSGASTETIRILLGHANTKTTERYLHTEMKSLAGSINKAFRGK